MLHLATDWATISALATGAGTLVLALATFASVRSSNRSARIAEAALQEQRRPLLVPSRMEDPVQKLMFVDQHWVRAAGGRSVAEHIDGIVYLAMSLRNVGSGMGVCQGWVARPGFGSPRDMPTHAPEAEFRLQTRDLYIPAGDIGMWQGALRNPDDPLRAAIAEEIDAREPFSIEVLYTDQVGRQRTITRFGLVPTGDSWLTSITRHWYLDWLGPRAERDVLAASEAVLRDQEAAEAQQAGAASEPGAATDYQRSSAPDGRGVDRGQMSVSARRAAQGDGVPVSDGGEARDEGVPVREGSTGNGEESSAHERRGSGGRAHAGGRAPRPPTPPSA